MNPERWNQVDKLLQSALERPEVERDVFLRAPAAATNSWSMKSVLCWPHTSARTAFSPFRRSSSPRASSPDHAAATTARPAAIL